MIKGEKAFVHELCAIWTPEVYLDARNRFQNMKQAIKRSNKLVCSYCKERGAGLGCFNGSCGRTYHYLCAKQDTCLLVSSKFIAYCKDCRLKAPEEEQNEEVEEDLTVAHYFCSVCKSGLDENCIVICDNCDLAYHTNCHSPKIEDPDILKDANADWFCSACINSTE